MKNTFVYLKSFVSITPGLKDNESLEKIHFVTAFVAPVTDPANGIPESGYAQQYVGITCDNTTITAGFFKICENNLLQRWTEKECCP